MHVQLRQLIILLSLTTITRSRTDNCINLSQHWVCSNGGIAHSSLLVHHMIMNATVTCWQLRTMPLHSHEVPSQMHFRSFSLARLSV